MATKLGASTRMMPATAGGEVAFRPEPLPWNCERTRRLARAATATPGVARSPWTDVSDSNRVSITILRLDGLQT